MEHEGKKKKPYHGIWIPFLAILIVPTIAYIIFYNVIKLNFVAEDTIHIHTALFFAGAVGFVFDIICVLSGFLSDLIKAFKNRISETHELFGLFTKEGFKYYWSSFFHDGGPIFWVFILISVAHAVIGVVGLITFLEWYRAQDGAILVALLNSLHF